MCIIRVLREPRNRIKQSKYRLEIRNGVFEVPPNNSIRLPLEHPSLAQLDNYSPPNKTFN